MKFLSKLSALVCIIVCLFNLPACKNQNDQFVFNGLHTQITISVSGKSLSTKLKNDISAIVSSLEKEFDNNIDNSFTKTFNLASKNQPVNLSDVALNVLSVSKTAYNLSNQSFDPTIHPLTLLWGFAPYKYNANFTPPNNEEILSAKSLVGFDLIEIDFTQKTAYKKIDGLKLDFGGIVKGYAVEEIAKLLKNNGYASGYVSVGSSSLKILSTEKLSVRHPRKTNQMIYEINLKGYSDVSVSTSGDYEKFHLTTKGEKFCHIIDPKTGYPTQTGVASATLLGIEGTLADALTTALCLKEFSPNDNNCELIQLISSILENYPLASVFVAYQKDDNKILLTNKKQGEDFTLFDSDYKIVKI